MIKKVIIYALTCSVISVAKAQSTYDLLSTSTIATPPNAASFTQYAKVPVGEFTGIPDIKVPLYNIKVDDFNLPVYLSYYARGVQPNVHSGWVGTGWSLVANGVINRKINGIPDEFCSDYATNASLNGNSQYGWYFGLNHEENYPVTTWGGIVQQYYPPFTTTYIADTAPDEFDFSFNGLSGAFFMGSDGNWRVRSSNGETIKIQETVGSVTVKSLQSPSSEFDSQTINPTFIQFVLTTGDGTKYIFGGGTSGVANTSIDFNRRGPSTGSYNSYLTAMAWHITEIDLPSGKKILFNYFRNGSLFTYTPAESSSFTSETNYAGQQVTNQSNTDYVDYNMSVMDPVYLQSIVFPAGELVFHSGLSNETDNLESTPLYLPSLRDVANNNVSSTYSPGVINAYNIFHSYTDLLNNYSYNSQGNVNSFWYQLNDIEEDDYNGNKLKDFKLTFTQDANTRLFLKSVQETDNIGNALPPYTFSYNSIALPMYCTLHTDHWGFYNGPKSFPTWSFDNNHFVSVAFQNSYYQYREPDTTYNQAGILTQINYPSGGYSQFTYQTNQYSKWVGTPISINSLSSNQNGGGLRIKKIVTTDNANLTPVTYEYSYVNNLANNVSSGVLGMPKPAYSQTDQFDFPVYDSNGNPLNSGSTSFGLWDNNIIYLSQNDDGNIITYSNVIERQSNNGVYNGMTVSVYSNHDNGYYNNSPDATAWTLNSAIHLFEYSDRSFERGMLLTETTYNQNNNPVKIIQNTYNNDPNRFNKYIKSIYTTYRQEPLLIAQPGSGVGTPPLYVNMTYFNNSAIRYYTFYPFLQQKTEIDYASDGSGNTVSTTTNYNYDPTFDGYNGTKNLIQTLKTDSRGEIEVNNTKYPLDYSLTSVQSTTDPFTLGIENLQSSGLYAVSIPVETVTQVTNADGSNVRTISATLNSYDNKYPYPDITYKAAITVPANTFTAASISVTNGSGTLMKDQTYEAREYIDNFDGVGNPLQDHFLGGPNQSYQWGYNNNYMVAVVKNATNTYQSSTNTGVKEFFYDSFEDDAIVGIPGHTGRNCSTSPVVTWALPDSKSYVISYWYLTSTGWKYSGELSYVPQQVGGNGGVYQMTGGTAYDDVRIYPVGAQMTTYTYNPLVGMTSSTDAKGETTYYEYDSFQRLLNIKDKDGNVTKHLTYHYQGQ